MKKTVFFLIALWSVQLSAQTIRQQFAAISSGAGTVSDMDIDPTSKGSTLIAMPLLLSPGIKVLSVTDNAPEGGNTYKQVPGTPSSCSKQSVDIWYCEKCNPGVTELKFHLSDHVRASINGFIEIAGLESPTVVDGSGAHVTDGVAAKDGSEPGPAITTTMKDFIVARYFSEAPLPTGVSPADWKYTTSFVYMQQAAPGNYRPTLTGGKAASGYCVSMAAFKTGPVLPASIPDSPATASTP